MRRGMNAAVRRNGIGVVGVGAAVCAACCAGPVLGVLAAAGLFTVIGVAVFGLAGLLTAVPLGWWLLRRRRRRPQCAPSAEFDSVAVPLQLTRRT
jgi:hypothetical protein